MKHQVGVERIQVGAFRETKEYEQREKLPFANNFAPKKKFFHFFFLKSPNRSTDSLSQPSTLKLTMAIRIMQQ